MVGFSAPLCYATINAKQLKFKKLLIGKFKVSFWKQYKNIICLSKVSNEIFQNLLAAISEVQFKSSAILCCFRTQQHTTRLPYTQW